MISPFLAAVAGWIVVALIDAAVKSPVAARYAPTTTRPWAECPAFWKDKGGPWYRWRNCLAGISLIWAGIAIAVAIVGFDQTPEWAIRFVVHGITIMVLEYPLYHVWCWILRTGQKQWYGDVCPATDHTGPQAIIPIYRTPRYPGELPCAPNWLPAIYRGYRLHRWVTVGGIVVANLAGATWI